MPTSFRFPAAQDEFVLSIDPQVGRRHTAAIFAARRAAIPAEQAPTGSTGPVGIVGAGLMGRAIAAEFLAADMAVIMADSDPIALQRAGTELNASTRPGASKAPPFQAAGDLRAFANCPLIIESIVEQAEAKRSLYTQLEYVLPPASILATNTSTLPIERLSASLAAPGRFCGMHFCHPVRQRPLVEIVRGSRTDSETVVATARLARRIGKLPIVVEDGPGFVVNRLLTPYANEAMQLLLEGAKIGQVEAAALEFGMAMGPLRLLDEIGLETALRGGLVVAEAFADRVLRVPLLVALLKSGRPGMKGAAGFFSYETSGQTAPVSVVDPVVERIIGKWARPGVDLDPGMVGRRLFLVMLLEATRILAEQRVASAADLDVALLAGLGFPPQQGGLLFWADQMGLPRILELLDPLVCLGERFAPTAVLRELAARGCGFYEAYPDNRSQIA